MSSFKQLTKSDVFVVPYTANKQYSLICNSPTTSFATFYEGIKYTGSFSIEEPTTSLGEYKRLVYDYANHSFYQSYSGSLLNTHSLLMTTDIYVTASEYRPTASYFVYNDKMVNRFPSGSGQKIQLVQIPQESFGEKVLPYSFKLKYGSTTINDDGIGNLKVGTIYVGNIFYSHGIAILTNQAYQNITYPVSLSYQNQYTVYENYISCKIKESEFNLSYNPTLISGSNTLKDFATGSYFSPYVTTIGLYNDNNDLLMVAKLAQPILISEETDMTFLIRYDG